jgi:hypothetical protein
MQYLSEKNIGYTLVVGIGKNKGVMTKGDYNGNGLRK